MRPLRRGTNLSRVAGFNEAVVIDAVRRARNGLSRVEISEQTGLSAQTVSNIVRRMLESSLLLEGDRINQGPGKPRTPLTLDPTGRYAIGVHLDPLVTTVVLVNLCGDVAAATQRPTPADAEPDDIIADIAGTISALIERAGVPAHLVAGVGLASPGPIDIEAGTIIDPPPLPRWRNVPAVQQLARSVGLPVVFDKDVIAGAVGERWKGATLGHANSLFLYLSTGVGVGVAVDDSIMRGATGNAGDVGHLIVDENGAPCSCGRRGCIRVTLSPRALIDRAVAAGVLDGTHLDATRSADPARVDESFGALCALVDAADPGALRLIDASAGQLTKAITTLADLFDTEVVALGGPTWMRLRTVYLPLLSELVGRHSPVEVVGTALGDDAIAIGAACLVLDHAFAAAVSAIALER